MGMMMVNGASKPLEGEGYETYTAGLSEAGHLKVV
jgi:hypothetical protein